MWSNRAARTQTVAIATAVLVCTALLLVQPVGAVGSPGAPEGQPIGWPSTAVDPDDVLLDVLVDESGTATWTVEYRVRLTTEDETDAFQSLADEIETDPATFESRFAERMEETAESAATATGREMSVENVSVEAEVRHLPQRYGVVTYRFDWHGFATVDGDELRMGDAIDGFFLDEQSRLLLGWTEGYDLASVSPDAHDVRESSVVWHGPIDFGGGNPRLVVTSAPIDTPPTDAPPDDPVESVAPSVHLLGALAVLVALVAGAILLRRAGWATSSRGRTRNDDADSPSDPAAALHEPLLSNEERVLTLLETRGGRVKQQEIVAELGWTAAKTSQVVRGMRDDGTVEVFRIGRENVVTLPDESGM